jgi:cytochrome c553
MKKVIVATLACAMVGVWGSALAAGDAAAGKTKSVPCSGCHGPDGNSTVPMYPRLAGQHVAYLESAMKAYKAGERTGGQTATMKPMVANLSDQDIADLAAYFSSQPQK